MSDIESYSTARGTFIPYYYKTGEECFLAVLCIYMDGFMYVNDAIYRQGMCYVEDFNEFKHSDHSLITLYKRYSINHKVPIKVINLFDVIDNGIYDSTVNNYVLYEPIEVRIKNKKGVLSIIHTKLLLKNGEERYRNVIFVYKDHVKFAGILTYDELISYI